MKDKFSISDFKTFTCTDCGKNCMYPKDYAYDVCPDCKIKELMTEISKLKEICSDQHTKVRVLSKENEKLTRMQKTTDKGIEAACDYFKENYADDDELWAGEVLGILEDFR